MAVKRRMKKNNVRETDMKISFKKGFKGVKLLTQLTLQHNFHVFIALLRTINQRHESKIITTTTKMSEVRTNEKKTRQL